MLSCCVCMHCVSDIGAEQRMSLSQRRLTASSCLTEECVRSGKDRHQSDSNWGCEQKCRCVGSWRCNGAVLCDWRDVQVSIRGEEVNK